MGVKILGGKLKSLTLKVMESTELRPTSVILRRKIFDAHQQMKGYCFYDLCAGTGAMGVEALSRGAEHVYFSEVHPTHFRFLKENLDKASDRLEGDYWSVYQGSFERALTHWQGATQSAVYYFDPPYAQQELYQSFVEWIQQSEKEGMAWIECDAKKGIGPRELSEWWREPDKIYSQGTKFICKYYL